MSALILDEITETVSVDADPDVVHFVCHCTNDNVAACGLDVTDEAWDNDAPEEQDCPLCLLAWPDGSLVCPAGCACSECGWRS